MEYGEIKYMINDFPELLHLQVSNMKSINYIQRTL